MRNKQNPSEGKIGDRMTVLGVVGFLVLAGSFFLLGLLCIGPVVKSRMAQRSHAPQTVYNPPVHRQDVSAKEEPQQPLDVQVTEQGNQPATTGDQTTQDQTADQGVKQDGNDLTVTLPESSDSSPAPKPPDAEAPRSRTPAPTPEPTTERPRAATETPHAATPPPPSDRVYRVQAGTFASRDNAQSLADDLRNKGYHPDLKVVQTEGATLYRVQLGRYKSQGSANKLAKNLSDDGYTPTIVPEKADQ